MQERLQKILSRAGFASRRGAEKIMAEGRITVNGQVVSELGAKADLDSDEIKVDGVRVPVPKAPVYLLLYKPKGVVTTRHDPEGRHTVMDLVPPVAGLFPVGRLDVTTEGVILLTNDGAFAEKVAHPRYEVPRVYHAKVHRVPDAATLARLREGVRVEGQRMAVDQVRVLDQDQNSWLEVTLHEGKHHEVKRLLEAVGHPVSKLRRVAVGSLTLRGLKPGEFRALTPQEVKALSSPSARRPPVRAPLERMARRPSRPPSRPPAADRSRRPFSPREESATRSALRRGTGSRRVPPVSAPRTDSARVGSSRTNSSRTYSSRHSEARINSSRTNSSRPPEARTNSSRTNSSRTGETRTGETRTGETRTGETRTNSAQTGRAREGASSRGRSFPRRGTRP